MHKNDIEVIPAFKENNIPVVFAADNNYIRYVKVMLHSLIKHTTMNNNYDLIIFNKDISQENKLDLLKAIKEYKNISLRFISMKPIIKKFNLKISGYYTIETYFRLFTPYILRNYNKAIYLDCDLIVCDDLANLFNTDIKNNLVAAVRDIGMTLYYYTKEKVHIFKEYFSKTLNGVNPNKYFNAGVILFNLEEFRKSYTIKEVLRLLRTKKFEYFDQDILNILCSNKTELLPGKWNVIPETPGIRRIENICVAVPKEYSDEYILSREKPSIIHYALKEKPWKYTNKLDPQLFNVFWNIASETECFKDLILEFSKKYSISEAYSIYSQYRHNNKLKEELVSSNINYLLDGNILLDMSKLEVMYDNVEFNENIITFEGKISIPNFIDLTELEVYLKINEELSKCETFIYPVYPQYKDQITDSCLRFKKNVDLNIKDKMCINICIKYKDVIIDLNEIKCDKHFILSEKYAAHQYYYNKNKIFTINKNEIHIENADKKEVIRKEILYLKYLIKQKNIYDKKAFFVRILYYILKLFKRKSIWIIGDNFLSDDNGFAFFKYLNSLKEKECKAYFAISKDNARYKEIKKMKNVLDCKKKIYKIICLLADCTMSSIIDKKIRDPFNVNSCAYQDILSKQKFIFLQHGITMHDVTREHNKYRYLPKGFIVSAKPEYDSMLSYDYYYKPKDIWLTGMPRFDYLYNQPKKYITIMPTWRKSIYSRVQENWVIPEFKESIYYKFYNGLLHDKRLHKCLDKNGYKLCICLHPLFKKAAPLFENGNNDFIVLNEKYRDVYAWSNLVITDYSSAIMDFIYLRKPILYTQFDKEEFFAKHVCTQGYLDYEKDGFGEVEYNLKDTVDRIIEYVENDCKLKDKYRERIDVFFEFNDKSNCQRLYEKIIKLEKKG